MARAKTGRTGRRRSVPLGLSNEEGPITDIGEVVVYEDNADNWRAKQKPLDDYFTSEFKKEKQKEVLKQAKGKPDWGTW